MGRKIAKVAVSKVIYGIDKPYDYLIPLELETTLVPGVRVLVPFGAGNRGSDGLVLSIQEEVPTGHALKSIQAQLDEEPVLDEHGIRLALWMRERCFCTLYDCVKAMLPTGLYFALQDTVRVRGDVEPTQAYQTAESIHGAVELLDLLYRWGGEGEMERIRQAFGTKNPNPILKQLIDQKVLELRTNTQRGVGDKTEKVAVLAVPTEEARELITPRRKSTPMHQRIVELLSTLGAVSVKELCYYTGASMQTLRTLERNGILVFEEQEIFRRPAIAEVVPALPPVLNEEQQQAFDGLSKLLETGKPEAALLYGVTGSGKTQIYIRLIQETLRRGKQAMVLVPEIVLTPQLLRIFTAHFGKNIALLHSSLRAGERYDEWKRAKSGEASVVLGTRSAVFAPLERLSLLILDEEQEPSYKSENTPRYHARDIAKYRCVQKNALLVLGSATPSMETMYQAQSGTIHKFSLTQRYNQKHMPTVLITDMKDELRKGNMSSISSVLRQELEYNLERGEQSILFLNRRGNSRMVACGECGHVPECPRCSVKLTYHSANGRLMCHYCGFSQGMPPSCPVCHGSLLYFGTGTQKVQEELEALFPGVELLRMDTDTISVSNSHESILERFRTQRIPILLGTQMVAKGLDFANVTLVGVVAPDLSLYVSDFRAAERTFSLLTQVVGRAGRGEKQGRAVIQTYAPEHEVIRFSAGQDYDAFYHSEISLRKVRETPPFSELLLFTITGLNEGAVLQVCTRLCQSLRSGLTTCGVPNWKLLGPAPDSIPKVNHRYRYHITLSGTLNRPVRNFVAGLLQAAQQEKENMGVSIYADWNPYHIS